ncbi:MAG: alpha/beta hydrolase [Alphaproteobacteria bacterium]|nr:alpha/beta hydrolase [Alphaproteobacteria bacterium]
MTPFPTLDRSIGRLVGRLTRRRALGGLAAAGAGLALSGCARVLSGVTGFGSDGTVDDDLAYGPAPRHRLDLYLPKDPGTDTPLVLFLYGGSWRWGSKERYGFAAYPLTARGFAVAVADYRVFPEVVFPGFNQDAARAVVWLQENRSGFGLGAGPVHLVGHSAGAHIAALLALDPRYLAEFGADRSALGKMVGLAGPYAIYPSQINYIADIFPRPPNEDQARPVALARADAPDMLLLHGGDDGIVASVNSTALANAQRAAGGSAEARVYEGLGHRDIVLSLPSQFATGAPVLDDTTAFLNA